MRMTTDTRNINDFYKYWEHEAIVADLQSRRNKFVTVVERINGDFNFGTVVRNNNCFLGERVIRCGIKRWDKRGAVGTHHYERVEHSDSLVNTITDYSSRGYRIVAIDNVDGAVAIDDYQWVPESVLLFGEEGRGLSQEALALADDIIYIRQFGSVRSLNVGTAAGIVMFDYCSKVV